MGLSSIGKSLSNGLAMLLVGAATVFSPLSSQSADSVRLYNLPDSPNIDGMTMLLRHSSFGQEGYDTADSTSFPVLVNPQALRAWTNPYSTNLLSVDSRPASSLTPYAVNLSINDNLATGVTTTTNNLFFEIVAPLDSGRKDYRIDVNIWGNGSSNNPYFSKTYGLQNLISNMASKTESWGITNVGNNVKYGQVIMTPLTNYYSAPSSGYSVNIQGGAPFAMTPTNFVDVPWGASVTSFVGNIYHTNAPGSRKKAIGLE